MDRLAQRLHGALPQTQCTRCGYPDCAAYAQAIAHGQAAINRCPPGGAEGIRRLAAITGQPVQPLDPSCGTEGPRGVAWIDEAWCIGCTLCIQACPVDCIVGSNKVMHTVIEANCTGCELCVAACPVDCIHMEPVTGVRTGWDAWSPQLARSAHDRYRLTNERRASTASDTPDPSRKSIMSGTAVTSPEATGAVATPDPRQAVITAALARARARRG
ncbi:MAG: RnfABCDGE type electron transport complex subunit B [Aquabacterium sp.]|nr:RnfABCDGE type electron transport complex subunit B [Aquabacterium sp.]